MSNQPLFTPYRMGDLDLPNRIVTAPLTRMRAQPHDHVPTTLQAEYYAQRASAGLIIAEATAISPEGFLAGLIRRACGHRSRSADGDVSRMLSIQPAAA
jgi:2,4-dienoyl-CoA reductase-like NADH-dependent reductase (Old Yellow Enzyme family)